jgi:hypothetical protein
MIEGANGIVIFNKAPLAGYPPEPSQKVKAAGKMKKVKWMFSKDACEYLGCTRRHLYWLTRHTGLPYWVFRSGPFPQYAFSRPQIDDWLQSYRGKGRELGLRKQRMGGGLQKLKKGA